MEVVRISLFISPDKYKLEKEVFTGEDKPKTVKVHLEKEWKETRMLKKDEFGYIKQSTNNYAHALILSSWQINKPEFVEDTESRMKSIAEETIKERLDKATKLYDQFLKSKRNV